MVTGRVRVVDIHRLLLVRSASPSDSWALIISQPLCSQPSTATVNKKFVLNFWIRIVLWFWELISKSESVVVRIIANVIDSCSGHDSVL